MRQVAEQFGATHQADDGADAIYTVRPPLPSGAPSAPYSIRIMDRSGWVVAREDTDSRLPAYCPERHINTGGWFCLYWHEAEPLRVVDATSAEEWWGKVVLFLQLQAVAAKLRRWPGRGNARAHGEKAAAFQQKAEAAAQRLGTRFETALRYRRLITHRRLHHADARVRLMLDGRRIATVLEKSSTAMTLRSRCPCDVHRRRPMKACGDHAEAIADLALSLDGWHRAEADFFRAAKSAGRICCKTINGCPLSTEISATVREAA